MEKGTEFVGTIGRAGDYHVTTRTDGEDTVMNTAAVEKELDRIHSEFCDASEKAVISLLSLAVKLLFSKLKASFSH